MPQSMRDRRRASPSIVVLSVTPFARLASSTSTFDLRQVDRLVDAVLRLRRVDPVVARLRQVEAGAAGRAQLGDHVLVRWRGDLDVDVGVLLLELARSPRRAHSRPRSAAAASPPRPARRRAPAPAAPPLAQQRSLGSRHRSFSPWTVLLASGVRRRLRSGAQHSGSRRVAHAIFGPRQPLGLDLHPPSRLRRDGDTAAVDRIGRRAEQPLLPRIVVRPLDRQLEILAGVRDRARAGAW